MSTKRNLLFALLSACSPFSAQAAFWSPHIGVDYKYWGLEATESNIGGSSLNSSALTPTGNGFEDLFPRIETAYNIYIGSRINGYFGFDIGYEQTHLGEASQTFQGGEFYFVNPENAQDAARVTLRLHDLHLDLNFYWEVMRRFEIIFMAGVAFVHIQGHVFHLTNGTWFEYRDENEMKTMGRIGIGAQYNFIPCFGIKALFSWEPDSRITFNGYDQGDNYYSIHPYKTSTMFSLGFVYSFSKPRRHIPVITASTFESDP